MSRESTWVGGDSQWDLHNGPHTHMHYIATLYRWYLIFYNTITIYKFLSLLVICLKSPLSHTLFCVSVDTQRAPGARMYIAIHIRRQFFERRQFPTEVKRKQEKTTARQLCTYLFFFFLLFFTLFFTFLSLYVLSTFFNAKCEFPDQDKDSSWQWTKTVFLPLFKSYEKFNGDFIS